MIRRLKAAFYAFKHPFVVGAGFDVGLAALNGRGESTIVVRYKDGTSKRVHCYYEVVDD